MKKRVFMGLVALALVVAMLPTTALADAENIDADEDFGESWTDDSWEEGAWEDEGWYEDDETELVNPFPDVPDGADYAEAVSALAAMGIFTGDERGNFNPGANITRAEMATIICRLLGVEEEIVTPRRQTYDDVPTRHWASGYIAKATELGVFNGDGTGNFRPSDNVTYEQVIKMLVCAMGYEPEAQRAGGWPNGYLTVAEDLGITAGIHFAATANAPRSAVVTLIYRAISNI